MTVVVCVLIARSRVLERAKAAIERGRPRPLLVSFVLSVMFLGLDWLLELPWDSYASWWREGRYGLTAVWIDFDRDGWPDLFVANDSGPNFLYKNNRDGTFSEIGLAAGCAVGGICARPPKRLVGARNPGAADA